MDYFRGHGGLSPNVRTVDQIKIIDRFREIPYDRAMAELLWSDPEENNVNKRDPSFSNSDNTGNITEDFLIETLEHSQGLPRGADYTLKRRGDQEIFTLKWDE